MGKAFKSVITKGAISYKHLESVLYEVEEVLFLVCWEFLPGSDVFCQILCLDLLDQSYSFSFLIY